MSDNHKPRIIILDDDHYPEGRVSQRVMPEFSKRNLGIETIHYKTISSLLEDLDAGKLSMRDLYVLDSSLEDEPDGHYKEFGYTLPALRDRGVKYENMMPASGGEQGYYNNQFFETIMEDKGRVQGLHQMDLKARGMVDDPLRVVDKILEFYKELNPKVSLEKETATSRESLVSIH